MASSYTRNEKGRFERNPLANFDLGISYVLWLRVKQPARTAPGWSR